MNKLKINTLIGIEFNNKNYFGLVLEHGDDDIVMVKQLSKYPTFINLKF